MKLTKYEHACAVLEQAGQTLVIDPGIFSASFPVNLQAAVVVITHAHSDHIDSKKLENLLQQNSELVIFAPNEVAQTYQNLPVNRVKAGDHKTVGPFELAFTGGDHAVIHDSMPLLQNVGVLINNIVYYPGDSFALPEREVSVLLAPAAAPWMKISEAMNFLSNVKSEMVVPTHDAVLSNTGKQVHDGLLQNVCEQTKTPYRRLEPGETIEF